MGYEYDVWGSIKINNEVPVHYVNAFKNDLISYFDWFETNSSARSNDKDRVYWVSCYDTHMPERIEEFYHKHQNIIDSVEIFVNGDGAEDFQKIVTDCANERLITYYGRIVYGDENIDDLCEMLGIYKRKCNVDAATLKEIL